MPDPTFSNIAGHHAVVTGGGRGIGLAIAKTLAESGAKVSIIGRNPDILSQAAGTIGADHSACDVTDDEALRTTLDMLAERHGPITILVNNAGAADSRPVKAIDKSHLDKMLSINFVAVALASQHVLGGMTAAGGGRIINVASTAGLKGYAYVAGYCAAKHAVIGFTRSMALETAKKNITVNAICPGYTDTDLLAESIANIQEKTGMSAEEARKTVLSVNPQGRAIEPDEVAALALWLCSDKARSVTGQAWPVAGGEVM